MDFVFGLPPDSKRRTGIVVFVDRFSKMVHLAAVPAEVTAKQTARLIVDMVFRHHGMPIDIVSDRDPRFTARFWPLVFTLLGTQLSMSTADHPQTDGKTERVNRVLDEALKSYAHPSLERLSTDGRVRHQQLDACLDGTYTVLRECLAASTRTECARCAVSTRARSARRPVNESTVPTPGVDTLNNNEQHAKAGPVVNKDAELNTEFSSKDMDFVQRRQAVIRFVQNANCSFCRSPEAERRQQWQGTH
ncbi:unnamed protein product [Phytophthora fragariaefolia]|uniref:Unnamed protein product n=1 Tax=Phytophthora fragariaefolia TaxID=1490495 RepID=A0A9W7D5W6_9STRA|nr:unnamed protein product [Phytophthora fragariaefolia]